jgi:tetratricopeptide (TPR) repeat protein
MMERRAPPPPSIRTAALAALLAGACAAPATVSPAPVAVDPAPAEPAPAGGSPAAAPAEAPGPGDVLRPDQILAILERSPIEYRFAAEAPVEGIALAAVLDLGLPAPRPVDPFVEVRAEGPEGQKRLLSSRPPRAIEDVFERAGAAFEAEEFEVARGLWARAAELQPGYFKSYTFLGNALHRLGDYARAEVALRRALELNPFDYQALLFLGDTYHQLGDHGRAKAMLSRAFMLNRRSPAVLDRLSAALAKHALRVRQGRLTPGIRIEQEGPGKVTLRFDQAEGHRWLPLAACLACWRFEDACSARAPRDQDPLHLGMFRECLIQQAASLAVRRDHDGGLRADEAALLGAVEEGYLEALIFWEVIGEAAPPVILLLPEEVQDDILRYIEKYVFTTTSVI